MPKCKNTECQKCASYGLELKKPLYCTTHKEQNMFIVTTQLCQGENCKKYCITPFCETSVLPKYEGYCLRCFVNTHPEKPNARNYKTKEKTVVDEVLKSFPQFTWTADKRVQDGCSRRRPDLFLDMGSHVIIVEIDENQHTDYDCSCENKRLMEISQDIGHRPVIFIRFNPDDYIDTTGAKIRSCFASDKT